MDDPDVFERYELSEHTVVLGGVDWPRVGRIGDVLAKRFPGVMFFWAAADEDELEAVLYAARPELGVIEEGDRQKIERVLAMTERAMPDVPGEYAGDRTKNMAYYASTGKVQGEVKSHRRIGTGMFGIGFVMALAILPWLVLGCFLGVGNASPNQSVVIAALFIVLNILFYTGLAGAVMWIVSLPFVAIDWWREMRSG